MFRPQKKISRWSLQTLSFGPGYAHLDKDWQGGVCGQGGRGGFWRQGGGWGGRGRDGRGKESRSGAKPNRFPMTWLLPPAGSWRPRRLLPLNKIPNLGWSESALCYGNHTLSNHTPGLSLHCSMATILSVQEIPAPHQDPKIPSGQVAESEECSFHYQHIYW